MGVTGVEKGMSKEEGRWYWVLLLDHVDSLHINDDPSLRIEVVEHHAGACVASFMNDKIH